MVQGVGVLVTFVIFALLMFKEKISLIISFMGMGLIIGFISGIPLTGEEGMIYIMFEEGAMKLAPAMAALIFGAWLGEVMNETGITKDVIRRASEFAGDKQFTLSIVMAIVVGMLFTALQGFGATIAVGTLVLPILSVAGVKPLPASVIFMASRTMGNLFNMTQWQLYMNITGLSANEIKNFAAVVSTVMGIGILIFIIVELKIKNKKVIAWSLKQELRENILIDIKKVPIIALFTPVIPFILVLVFQWPIVPALFVGVLFGALSTSCRDAFRVLTKTLHEGIKSAVPAFVTLMGIGMLLSIVQNQMVTDKLLPVVNSIIPTTPMGYIIFFSLFAPLALYRGPMNLWGLGSGVMALMIMTNSLPVMAVVAGFFAAHIIQLCADPTNTHNIWTTDFLDIELNQLTIKALPYLWAMSIVCVIVGAIFYL